MGPPKCPSRSVERNLSAVGGDAHRTQPPAPLLDRKAPKRRQQTADNRDISAKSTYEKSLFSSVLYFWDLKKFRDGCHRSLTISRLECRERSFTSSGLRPTPNPRRTILVLLALNVEDSSVVVVIGPVPGRESRGHPPIWNPRKSRTPTDLNWESRGHQTRSGFSSVSSGRNSESSPSMLIGRRG